MSLNSSELIQVLVRSYLGHFALDDPVFMSEGIFSKVVFSSQDKVRCLAVRIGR